LRRIARGEEIQEAIDAWVERHPRADCLESQSLPSRRRPLLEIEAVIGEQRHGQAIDAERDAAGMSQLVVVVTNAPHLAEVLAVIVKAHARGG